MPATPLPRRRRWPWVMVGILVLLVVAVWFGLPWAACRWLRAQSPLNTGTLTITGAAWGGTPPAAMVVGTCDRATLLAIWRGASGKGLPAVLLAGGQHVWGTFSAAPEFTWRLDIDDSQPVPRLVAAIPGALAERLLAARLARTDPPLIGRQSDLRIATATLTGTPLDDDLADWTLELAGHATIEFNQQPMPLDLGGLALAARTRRGPPAPGGSTLAAELRITRLAGEAPLLGRLEPLTPWLQDQLRAQTASNLAKARIPVWWPRRMMVDLRVVPADPPSATVQEF